MTPQMKGEGKLGAYRTNGGDAWDPQDDENVLYLGAAEGVTATWISQRLDGTVLAVEKSPVGGLGLLQASRDNDNLIPYIGDARHPSAYAPLTPRLGLLYQDIAQRDQVELFVKNLERFYPRRGFLAVKARSIAVERDPEDIFQEAKDRLSEAGKVVDMVRLAPFHKDHAMIVVDTEKGA